MKKCTVCGTGYDDRLAGCPKCSAEGIRPLDLSDEQWKEVERQHKEWHKKKRKRFLAIVTVVCVLFPMSIWGIYWSSVRSIKSVIVYRVVQEFNEPRIKNTVEDVAATTAKRLMREEITPEVERFKQEMQNTLEQSIKLSQNAQEQFDQLKSIIELEDAARFGSRKAYLSLKNIASIQNPFAVMAKRRVSSIERDLLSYRSVPGIRFGLTITRNDEKIKADNLSTFELFQYLQSTSLAKDHIPSMMGHIANKPKNEVCESAKDILEHSDSLIACAATCGVLRKVLGDKAPFLAFEQWIKVCDKELGN